MSPEYMGANMVGMVMYSLSHVLAQVAVPAFFLISGYLFFLKLNKWNFIEWRRKVLSRFWSIVVPYLICITVIAAKHLIDHHLNGDLEQWLNASGGLLNLYWSSEHWVAGHTNIWGQPVMMSGPAAYHLWFLRDLIVAVLLTPVFYLMFAMRAGRRRMWAVLFLMALCLLDLTRLQIPIPGLSCSTVFYFGLGSFLSLNGYNLSSAFYKYRHTLAIAFVAFYLCLIPLDGSRTQLGTLIMPLENLLGVMCVINIAAYCTAAGLSLAIFHKYEKTSFFMFIIHPFLLAVVWRFLIIAASCIYGTADINSLEFVNCHPVATLFIFFTKITIAAILSIWIYHALTRVSPRLSRLICGR